MMRDLKQVDLKQVRDEVADRVGRAAKELGSGAGNAARELGASAEESRRSYLNGWPTVLQQFVERSARPTRSVPGP